MPSAKAPHTMLSYPLSTRPRLNFAGAEFILLLRQRRRQHVAVVAPRTVGWFAVGVMVTPQVTERPSCWWSKGFPVVTVAVPVVTLALTEACAVGKPVVVAL